MSHSCCRPSASRRVVLHSIDLSTSALAGDSDADLAVGLAVKVALLIKVGAPVSDSKVLAAPHCHAADLYEARRIILAWNADDRDQQNSSLTIIMVQVRGEVQRGPLRGERGLLRGF
jgi:hypothetical protein